MLHILTQNWERSECEGGAPLEKRFCHSVRGFMLCKFYFVFVFSLLNMILNYTIDYFIYFHHSIQVMISDN